VTTGAEPVPEPELGTVEAPLEAVVTGADEEDGEGEPVEDSDVPAPVGCFGFRCLVTWIVRRITLVRTKGLETVAFWLPALSASPARPPSPTTVAAAAILVFKFFTALPPVDCTGSLGSRC
jgi:hypothetical protein